MCWTVVPNPVPHPLPKWIAMLFPCTNCIVKRWCPFALLHVQPKERVYACQGLHCKEKFRERILISRQRIQKYTEKWTNWRSLTFSGGNVLQVKKECMGPQVLHPCALLCSQCASNDSLEKMGFHSATKITEILCKSDYYTQLLRVPIGSAWSLGCGIFLKSWTMWIM